MRSAWVLLLSAVAVEVPTAADLDGATTNANGEEELEIAPWDEEEGFEDDDGDDEGADDDEDSALEGMQVEARPFRVSLLESLQGRLSGRKLAAVDNFPRRLDATLQGKGVPSESECVQRDDCGGGFVKVCKYDDGVYAEDRVYMQCSDRRRTAGRRRNGAPRQDRRRYWYTNRAGVFRCCGCSVGECQGENGHLAFQETTESKTEDGGRLYLPFVLSTVGIVVIALSLVVALGCLLRPVQNDPVATTRVTRHLNFAEQGRGDARSPSQPVARN